MKTTAAVLFLGIISTFACFNFANADDDVDDGLTTTQRSHLPSNVALLNQNVPANQGTNPPPSNSTTTLPMVDSCIL